MRRPGHGFTIIPRDGRANLFDHGGVFLKKNDGDFAEQFFVSADSFKRQLMIKTHESLRRMHGRSLITDIGRPARSQ